MNRSRISHEALMNNRGATLPRLGLGVGGGYGWGCRSPIHRTSRTRARPGFDFRGRPLLTRHGRSLAVRDHDTRAIPSRPVVVAMDDKPGRGWV